MTQNKEATMPYTYPDVLRAVKMSASVKETKRNSSRSEEHESCK